jgi:phenylpropionate dioxygenase-like ring-hydroxylating dioxygenase large terminal subunit
MAGRTFLDAPYSGYLGREVPAEDAELTHVGPGTPCGEYLRRFWQPVALSSELADLPVRVRILGEDLVLFRDGAGRVGLVQMHCPHRGTSLEYGLVSARGLRCCYHGWLFDVDGTILETPGEPSTSTLRNRLCLGAYPTLEYQGLVFAYLGPTEAKPEFPIYDMYEWPGVRRVPIKTVSPCNWLQIQDNSMDPVHTSFLHTIVSGAQFTPEFGVLPEIEFQETPMGMIYIATRRVGDNVWVRINDFLVPNARQFPPESETGRQEKQFNRPMAIKWAMPVDDTHTLSIGYLYVEAGQSAHDDERSVQKKNTGQTAERSYEERQRRPGDYDAQVGQRSIAVHALEHLGHTDRGVIMLRRIIRQGIRAVQAGSDPKGLLRTPAPAIATYSQDTVVRVPQAASLEADQALLREVGRKVAAGHER